MKPKQEVHWIEFPLKGSTEEGFLTPAEVDQTIPFEIRRVVWLHGLWPDMIRGNHANRRCHQVFACLAGAVTITADFGYGPEKEYRLVRPSQGLYMAPLVWRVLKDFAPNTVVLILSSEKYLEGDYIRDYQVFKKEVGL